MKNFTGHAPDEQDIRFYAVVLDCGGKRSATPPLKAVSTATAVQDGKRACTRVLKS
jgi:hypothetical protein